jgi:hypothetical protein
LPRSVGARLGLGGLLCLRGRLWGCLVSRLWSRRPGRRHGGRRSGGSGLAGGRGGTLGRRPGGRGSGAGGLAAVPAEGRSLGDQVST